LCSFGSAGPEIPVAGGGSTNIPSGAVATDSDGDFVVVWQTFGNDSTYWDVFGQRYGATGIPKGGAFRVNSTTSNVQWTPTVAMDNDGDFVVTWTSYEQDGSRTGVYARRYNANGVAQGAEFQVNTQTYSDQRASSVAMDATGNFVITWESASPDGQNLWVYGQRFDASGVRQAGEFGVSTLTDTNQETPQVAMDADGDFVVVWLDLMRGVQARRYDATGAATGDAFRVITTLGQGSNTPSVAMAPDGRFVVAWVSRVGVLAKKYNATGEPQGGEFQVNTNTNGTKRLPDVAMSSAGDFVISWNGHSQNGSDGDVFARRYNSSGAPIGEEFLVNERTSGEQLWPSVAMDSNGDFVVVWTDEPQDGVYAQRYLWEESAAVNGRHVFYNHSSFDGNDTAADAADDGAIATDKAALLPGQSATFANVTGYSRGINGVMVDIAGLPEGVTLTAADFQFRSGADLSTLFPGPSNAQVSVRRGAGVNGSDRVTLTWPDYVPNVQSLVPMAAAKKWLEVTVKADANTGLAAPDVFYFGNLIAETGDPGASLSLRVNALDLGAIKRALNSVATITSTVDPNRDGRVNALDLGIAKQNLNQALSLLAVPIPAMQAAAVVSPGLFSDGGTAPTRRLPDELLR
jgi:hypothetical protein